MQTKTSNENITYASIGKRAAAWLIDALLLSIPTTILLYIFNLGFGAFIRTNQAVRQAYPVQEHNESTNTTYLVYIIIVLMMVAYFATFESFGSQATPGKMVTGLRVVSTDGKSISFIQALKRAFVKVLLSGIFFIGYLMAFANDRRITLHDRLAGTVVVEK